MAMGMHAGPLAVASVQPGGDHPGTLNLRYTSRYREFNRNECESFQGFSRS